MKPKARPEASFLSAVLALARLCGWRAAHFRPARTRRSWRTALQGDGAGFPDLILVRADRALFIELKSGRGQPTAGQLVWLHDLQAAGLDARLWRPADWPEIEATLS